MNEVDVMKPEDLRIGNIVLWNDCELIIDPSDIVAVYQCQISGKDSGRKGIPITPELLIRAGFERVKFEPELRGEFHIGKYHVSIKKQKMLLVNSIGMFHEIGKCRYLHQLQNLHYCLTGTELTTAPHNDGKEK